jgi:hypothetical protein
MGDALDDLAGRLGAFRQPRFEPFGDQPAGR